MKKWLLILLYILIMLLAFIYRDPILEFMQQHDSFSVLLMLSALLALFPIIPYKLVIAALGFAYGTFWAAVISWLGTMIAAAVIYALVRYVFREQGRRYLSKINSLDTFTTWIEAHPFTSVAAGRLMPIVPQMAVNVFAGVASVPFWTFTLASGLGKIPGIFLYAFLGGNLTRRPLLSGIIITTYILFLAIMVLQYRKSTRRDPK
ncbi:TVP38/TMEM64 family protein [Paenibacillus pini]|uniref:TVP38/TMEM64 family membrane protein n=1 Tax=Paenibacillus pini JCM 16418 TaxID=1236976 RepID=W7YHZ0_9BACL|nr:VTT domain-containing protein [Paenibacillus pini]GAF07223.1 hypothetical protein JCM16418_1217 [Paenibacillus pini JCM 16418]